ncbi:hypothetical protein Vafri_1506 [Volvox africanus]|nr:hypothetical protein Vafri_1506 [Volvox africanus]
MTGTMHLLAMILSGLVLSVSRIEATGERLLAEDTNTYSYSCNGNSFQYEIQRPYSSSSSSPYFSPWPPSSVGSCGNITLKVSTKDDPFKKGSPTNPRAELRLKNEYSGSTVRDTSFKISIKDGVVGANLFQIFDTVYNNPCLQLRVSKNSNGISQITYHGADGNGLADYGPLVTGIQPSKWTLLRILHDAGANTITLYVDGQHKARIFDRKLPRTEMHYHKIGVYASGKLPDKPTMLQATYRDIIVR